MKNWTSVRAFKEMQNLLEFEMQKANPKDYTNSRCKHS